MIAPHHVRKTITGWQPISTAAREFHAKTKLGQIVEMQARRPRNPGHHRKAFALFSIVADNCEQFSNAEDVLTAVKAALGMGRWLELAGASRPIFMPDSISFSAMDQTEFEAFYKAAVAAIQRWWLPVEDTELRHAVEEFAA